MQLFALTIRQEELSKHNYGAAAVLGNIKIRQQEIIREPQDQAIQIENSIS